VPEDEEPLAPERVDDPAHVVEVVVEVIVAPGADPAGFAVLARVGRRYPQLAPERGSGFTKPTGFRKYPS
jgi:hypothetical protein